MIFDIVNRLRRMLQNKEIRKKVRERVYLGAAKGRSGFEVKTAADPVPAMVSLVELSPGTAVRYVEYSPTNISHKMSGMTQQI